MGLEGWAAFADRHRRWMILVALVTTFAGVGLVIDRPKGTVFAWLAVPLVAIGGAVFAWAVWPQTLAKVDTRTSLASRFLRRVTFNGRLVRLFPVLGVGIILADVAYNFTLSATPGFQTEDTIVLLAAATLLGYGFIPTRFARERDFVLVFFVCLNAILVLPLLLARLYYQDLERSVDIYSWTALAPQTAWTLNFLGVPARVEAFPWTTAPGVTFATQSGAQLTVIITTACSGIYSFGIFASAFVAFVLTEYDRFEPRVFVLLGLGFLTSYIANILRMVMIVLFGVYSATPEASLQNMLLAHSNLGWIIFLGWITLFWAVVFRFFVRRPAPVLVPEPRKRGVLCGICENALTPALPGYRCECGRFYHVACAATVEECPKCHRSMKIGEASASPTTP